MSNLLPRLVRPVGVALSLSCAAFGVIWSTGPSAPASVTPAAAYAVAPAVPEPVPTVNLAAQPPAAATAPAATSRATATTRPRSVAVDDDGLAGRAATTRSTTTVRRGPETLAERRARLLAMVPYNWRALGFSVVLAGGRTGLLGLTEPQDRSITIYVRAGQSDRSLLDTLAHEIGHAVDITYGTKARRDEYLRLRGISSAWWPCGSCSDYASGAGDFAEVFAVWVVGSHSFSSQLAGRPTAAQLRGMRHLFVADPVAVAALAAEAKAAAAAEAAAVESATVSAALASPPPVVPPLLTGPATTPAYVYPQPVRSPYTWTFSYPTYDGSGVRRPRR